MHENIFIRFSLTSNKVKRRGNSHDTSSQSERIIKEHSKSYEVWISFSLQKQLVNEIDSFRSRDAPQASLSHRISGVIPDQSERISMQIRTQATRYQKTKRAKFQAVRILTSLTGNIAVNNE